MTKPDKYILIKVHTINACLIEDTEVYELPIDKLEATRNFLNFYSLKLKRKDGK